MMETRTDRKRQTKGKKLRESMGLAVDQKAVPEFHDAIAHENKR